jgi:YYY domain-containing protein
MLPVISWWLVIQLFGLAALPLTWRLFARLPGRGYPFAKVLGLLLVSYFLWLGASFRLLPNATGGILVALFGVCALSAWLGQAGLRRDSAGRRPLVVWMSKNRSVVITTEVLFLLVFAGWSAFRAYNPEISGTEKPMEFAFINGILGSRFFPPQDPWLSGYGISYYYFGYVMIAALVRVTGVLPEVGFNLAVALWYALTMISAFGVVYAMIALSRTVIGRHPLTEDDLSAPGCPSLEADKPHGRVPIAWGLFGSLLVGFIGNLEGLIDGGYQRRLLPIKVVEWLNVKGLTDSPPTGDWTGGFWWWWRASRVIHDLTLPDAQDQRASVEVIDEFPFFSFLLGDLHPHVLALPFVLLAILLCLNLLVGALTAQRRPESRGGFFARVVEHVRVLADATGLSWGGILLYAMVLGSLGFLNTWDFPIYLGLAALAIGSGIALRSGLNGRSITAAALTFFLLAAVGYLVYIPFYVGFQSQLGGILPNLLFPSRFSQFFVMFGPFLVVVVFFLLLLCLANPRPRSHARYTAEGEMLNRAGWKVTTRSVLVALPWTLLLPLLLMAAVTLGFIALPQGRAFVAEALQRPEIAANVADASLGSLIRLVMQVRVGSPWTYLVLAVLLAWVIGTAWVALRRGPGEMFDEERASSMPVGIDLFALLLTFLAFVLTLVPEFIYLRDLFGNRMNTVFKFYYQAWVLLALASAYALSRLAASSSPAALRIPALILSALLVLGGLCYPLSAIPSKADNFRGAPTLDGLAYLHRDNPTDMSAIEWLRNNVPRDAVLLEATGGSYSPEGAGRVSMATGNPTLLGWDFHERQWRGNEGYDELAAMRPAVIDQIYRSAQAEQLPGILEQWGVDYVYIGGLERSKYGISDATLARFDAHLKRVYDVDGVRIYAR